MAIDIRATVTCSLGTLISGSISDDYIQGSGLVKTKGSIELNALITPAIGTVVTFSYVKGGVTRSIPRKLRVMSSFADPFRRTTKVELGCKLTYLSDLQEPVDWTAFDDPENAAYDADDARIVTLPIYASSAMDKCLTELGITASSNPLTNKFSIAEFDFEGGYVSVLSDLLVSESYCGYLDTSEVLQVFFLDQDAGTGPVFTASDIVDLGPIGVGQLPGEAVTVSYSTLKLKDPDPDADAETINWERSVSSSPVSVLINYGENQSKVYTGFETTVDTTLYTTINDKEVPSRRVVSETRLNASVAGGLVQEYLENGLSFNTDSVQGRTVELFFYDDEGNEIGRQLLRYQSGLETYGSVGLPMVFSSGNFVALPNPNNIYLVEKVVTIFKRSANYTRTETYNYGLWNLSIPGQQAIASARGSFASAAQVESYIQKTLQGGLVLLDSSFDTRFTGSLDSQERPSAADRINSNYADGGDPNNGWRTDSTAELELALGSATAQRRIEFSLPYAPDDIFSGPSGGPFTATPSDAPAKANRYGRVQNRLLLGNRSGVNLQLSPERLPAAPFEPLYVQANGLTAQYRANGTSWAFDSNGIVASVDALFWSAVGGTGTFWFPVAPGITTLPTTPAIVDGTMTPTTVVLPYNETAVYESRISITTAVTKFEYSLTLLTVVPASLIKLQTVVQKAIQADVGSFTFTGQTAQLSRPNRALGAEVGVFVLTDNFVRFKPDRLYPADTGIFVLTLRPAALSYSGGDPSFNDVQLLLHANGSNGSTVFTDSGPLALTPTRNGNTIISTTQSKFGGASLYFDGSGDSLQYADNEAWNLGANNFTIEAWAFPVGTGSFFVATQRQDSDTEVAWLFYFNDTRLVFDWSFTGTGTDLTLEYNWLAEFAVNTWVHVAVCRSGNTLRLFKNGIVVATAPITDTIYNSTASMLVGRRGSTTSGANGYMDELRITRAARYTGNFTVQTQAFPDSPQTV